MTHPLEKAIRDVGEQIAIKNRAIAEKDTQIERLRAKLIRVRDWIKFAANSERGIVAEMDDAIEPQETE